MNAKMNNGQMKEVLKRHKNFNSAVAIGHSGRPAERKTSSDFVSTEWP